MTRTQSSPTTIRPTRAAWLVAIAAVIALGGVSGTAQGQGQGRGRVLFADGGSVEDAPGNADPTRRRGRRVRANVMALHDTSGPSTGDITLNLFDDVQLRARRQRLEPTLRGGSVWHGRLLDVAGDATIAVNDGVMAGTVFAEDRIYEILYAGDGEHEIREIEPSAFPTDDPHVDLPLVEPDAQAGVLDPLVEANAAADSASQIDVMVVWTPAARSAAGSEAAMQSLVDLSVANTNTAYANSSVTQRIRLVYSGEVTYTESGISTDLSRLTSTADGHMDTVHTLRNTYGADVVTLIGNGYASAGACGLGYLMSYVSTGFASTAFNVVDRTCSAGNLSFPHELGHNMGLQHDPGNAGSSPAYSYAYGYQDPGGSFRTVMSYGGAPRITRFSNPNLTYNGKVTGTSTQNNALALNNTASSVANFRQATVGGGCTYSLGSSSTSVGAGSASGTVSVVAGSGCAWTATSNAAWITVTGGASGTSNGSVGYSVAANTVGTSRTGTLTIGGQTFTVTQAAAACSAFSLSPTSTNVVAGGGTVTVAVSGTTGCARTATSNAAWITVTAGASGTGAGTVSLSVAANTAGTSRMGTVTIGGQTFTVTQAAAACGAFSLSPTSATVVAGGGTVNVTVSGTTGCARTATSNAAWITVTAGASGTGAGTVSLSVAANTAGTSRTGTVTIGGQAFTVTQAAAPCSYELSSAAASFPSGGGSGSFTLTTPSGCSATANTASTWIVIASGATGSGPRTIAYSVAPNSGNARSGGITIGGLTFGISQAKRTGNSRNVAKADFTGDGMADLLWQQDGGAVALWEMSGVTALSTGSLSPGHVDPAWRMVGSGDLDGNGHPEIVWQHRDGWLASWFMSGSTVSELVYLTPNRVDTAWQIAALGDLNADGRDDLIWQHDQGSLGVWFMNGAALQSTALLTPSAVPVGWRVSGVGDMNDDGRPDLLWQHLTSGMVGAWLMNGTTATSFTLLSPGQVDPAVWSLRGVVDLDGDGQIDMLWQHASGPVLAWLMQGTGVRTSQWLPASAALGSSWRLVGPR